MSSLGRLLRHHHLDELLVVDLPVAIDVRLADHLVDLLVRQLLAEVRHHVAQLGGADEAVAITVEHLEGLDELLSVSVSFILRAMSDKNSGKSMVPFPSASTSLIMS